MFSPPGLRAVEAIGPGAQAVRPGIGLVVHIAPREMTIIDGQAAPHHLAPQVEPRRRPADRNHSPVRIHILLIARYNDRLHKAIHYGCRLLTTSKAPASLVVFEGIDAKQPDMAVVDDQGVAVDDIGMARQTAGLGRAGGRPE